MKFRDKAGNVFEDIEDAWRAWKCPGFWKYTCIKEYGQKCEYFRTACDLYWIVAHPAEAARLMGYEIVEDAAPESLPQGCHPDPPGMKGPPCGCPVCGRLDCIEWDGETDVSRCTYCGWSNGAFASKIKEVSMDKPLKDWTLGEVKEWCYQYRRAHDAPCENSCDMYKRGICMKDWAHEWDLETAPRFTEEEVADAKVLARALLATGFKRNRYEDIYAISECAKDTLLDSSMFPSILPGQTVKLSDILGDPNTERR